MSEAPSSTSMTPAEKAVVLLEEMRVELDSLTEEKDRREALRNKVITLTGAEVQALKQKVELGGDDVPDVFKQEWERGEILNLAVARLEALKTEVDLNAQPDTEQVKPKGLKEEITDMSVKVAEMLPETMTKDWSKEKKRNVGMAMTVGATIVIGGLLWMFAKTKDKAKKAGALVAAGVAAGAAYFGWKKFGDDILKKFGIDKAKQKVDDAKDAIDDAKEKIKDKLPSRETAEEGAEKIG